MKLPEPFNAATYFVDRHVAEGRAERPAFRFGGGTVTYGALATGVAAWAARLAALGVGPGDRVLLVLHDSPAFAGAFWGAVRLGAVAVPVNTLMAPPEYAFLLRDSEATVAVVADDVADRIRAACAASGRRCQVVATGPSPEPVAGERGPADAATTCATDIMYWGYTSGSTGEPKAALHTHQDFVAAAELVGGEVFGIGPDDVTFSASKMSFAFGLGNSLFFPQRVGAASILVPERVEALRALELIHTERPTVFFAVPTLYARIVQVPDAAARFDLSSLRFCVSSGEPLPPALFDAWRARFGGELVDVVGSTENLHDFIANRPGAARRGSAGRLVPGFEARLVDDGGAPVPAGTVGHLLIKGPTTAPGYWNRPERTAATMREGWLRTGDMFWQDAEGYYYFAGRADDMLKVAGQWVAPAEVEARLVEHPAVLEAAVTGRPDHDGLCRPHATVVLRDGQAGSPALVEELRSFLRARLAGYKVPPAIEVVGELPKTATGKIQRFRLRAGA